MNPYVSDPENIPASDIYAVYSRYFPKADDFQVDPQHINFRSIDSLQYWASVVNLYNESVRIYPAEEGGRNVFAFGSVIVKSSHLHKIRDGRHYKIDYSYADTNKVEAITLAKSILKDIRVPEIYFAGKVLIFSDCILMPLSLTSMQINDCQVLIQERLPGVALNVVWPYLS